MQFYLSRFFNFIFALLVFLPVSVFIVVLSLVILAVNRFNPFFISKRVGKNGKEFTCYKLQTLEPVGNNEIIINSNMNKLRLTKLGEIYRNHGWDELPQIVNIIKGDMNFIGPRPILENVYQDMNRRYPNEKDLINKWKIERLKYTAGLSGWH